MRHAPTSRRFDAPRNGPGSVTRQLLAFSRKQLLEPRVFDLNETVAAIARLLSRLLGADGARAHAAVDELL